MIKELPSIERLWEEFYVDSSSPSGLRNVKRRGSRSAQDGIAGVAGNRGYWIVKVGGLNYAAHRVVHALRSGCDNPEMEVDHRDRNRANNHPFNLRWLDRSGQNLNSPRSNPHGFTGVFKRGEGWGYSIQAPHVTKRERRQGYSSPQEAYEARKARLRELKS